MDYLDLTSKKCHLQAKEFVRFVSPIMHRANSLASSMESKYVKLNMLDGSDDSGSLACTLSKTFHVPKRVEKNNPMT